VPYCLDSCGLILILKYVNENPSALIFFKTVWIFCLLHVHINLKQLGSCYRKAFWDMKGNSFNL
jgi:hypothetical protein